MDDVNLRDPRPTLRSPVVADICEAPGTDRSPGTTAAGRTPSWHRVDLAAPGALERVIPACLATLAACGDSHIYHDPEWLIRERPPSEHDVVLYASGDTELAGFAPFIASRRGLAYKIGEVTLAVAPLDRLTLSQGPVLQPGEADDQAAQIEALFDRLARDLTGRQAIAIDGVRVGGQLHRAVTTSPAIARRFHVLQLSGVFEHRTIEMPDSYASYEKQFSGRTRNGLRRRMKRLVAETAGQTEMRCFTAEADVDEFIAGATAISRKTYQWHLLGIGLRDVDGLRAKLRFSARRGWMRNYILYCRGEPASFILGYLYRGTYHYLEVGYDPAWEDFSVGTLLHSEAIRDLFGLAERPHRFDFMIGDGVHKERFSNCARHEVSYLLLKKGPRAFLVVTSYRAMAASSAGLVWILDRLNLRTRAKRLLRRLAMRGSGD